MRANFGEHFKLTIFGESHGPAIGVVLDGLPAGAQIDETYIARQMARRAPGNDPTATARKEADAVRVLSGVHGGRATVRRFSARWKAWSASWHFPFRR